MFAQEAQNYCSCSAVKGCDLDEAVEQDCGTVDVVDAIAELVVDH